MAAPLSRSQRAALLCLLLRCPLACALLPAPPALLLLLPRPSPQFPPGALSASLAGAVAMVYIDNWDDFQDRSIVLFRSDPVATRYVMKYRHCDGKLVLKVTDDKVCLKFKTDQAQDIRKMEKLNNTFFSLMARGPDAEVPEDLPKEPVAPPPSKKGRGRRQ